jgi:hypothetical protein
MKTLICSNRTIALIAALAALSGCASTADVLPTGKNTFMIAVSGWGVPPGGDTLTPGIRIANEFCARRNQVATIIASGRSGVTAGTVQFACSDESDQAPSVLRPDNGVSTVVH